MKCVFYDKGNCGIWQFTKGICSTWFCQSDQGISGLKFWKNFGHYIKTIEQYVSFEALPVEYKESSIIESFETAFMAKNIYANNQKDNWVNWFGRELEFYKNCARNSRNLSKVYSKMMI